MDSKILLDVAIAFGFEFNGADWTFIVRRSALVCDRPRVDVFENGENAGTGYLLVEEGPMFDASHHTPIGGKSIEEGDGEFFTNDADANFTKWGEMVWGAWKVVAPGYVRLTAK